MSARADDAGTVRLEVRNEAMETHYINHLELLEVIHAQDEVVVPDQQGRPVVVSGFSSPEASRNRAGHDLSAVLKATDADDYRSASERIDQVTADDLDDWIDMTVSVEPGAREVALVFRLRNSLFSTVLLYDFMLGRAETFRPADDTLVAALREWGARRDAFETEFMTARVPVR